MKVPVSILVVLLAAGGLFAERIDLTLREGTFISVALAPDGRSLAMELLSSLWILPVEGGNARRLTDALQNSRRPAWFPDGKRIAFQTYHDGTWDIATIAPDGTGWQLLTNDPFDDQEPQVSPDGRLIAFSSDRSGNYDIWTIDLNTRELKRHTTGPENEFMPTWSPDGKRLAYVSDRRGGKGIWAVDETGREEQLIKSAANVSTPSWSPDGKQLVYTQNDRNESRLMLGNDGLTTGEDVFPSRAQWASADEFFYAADGKIKRRSLKTGAARNVEFTASVTLQRDVYPRKHRDFDSDQPKPALGVVRPMISPDGQQIAFAALGDIWVAGRKGELRQITKDPYLDADPAWSPDGSRLVFSSDRKGTLDLWIHDFKTGQQRRLTDLNAAEKCASWSPRRKPDRFCGSRRRRVHRGSRIREGSKSPRGLVPAGLSLLVSRREKDCSGRVDALFHARPSRHQPDPGHCAG